MGLGRPGGGRDRAGAFAHSANAHSSAYCSTACRTRSAPPWPAFLSTRSSTGPPVVAYWLSGRGEPAKVRANLILLFAISTVFTTITYFVSGLLSLKVLAIAALVGPLYALGLFLGAKLFGKASEIVFRRICYGLIALSVLSSLPIWR